MTEPISPDLVNAIVRNPDDPRYPSQITVFCDDCGTEHTADYMVSEDMTSIERLAVSRQHLVANKGWQHTEGGDDFCPVHAGSPAEEQPAAGELAPVEDSLPAWLYQRFAVGHILPFDALGNADRTYWEHEAAAVRRAVARGGFKTVEEQPAAEGAQR